MHQFHLIIGLNFEIDKNSIKKSGIIDEPELAVMFGSKSCDRKAMYSTASLRLPRGASR